MLISIIKSLSSKETFHKNDNLEFPYAFYDFVSDFKFSLFRVFVVMYFLINIKAIHVYDIHQWKLKSLNSREIRTVFSSFVTLDLYATIS